MKDRAIIPIHNDTGESVVGIIGRATKHYRTPKFLFYQRDLISATIFTIITEH